MKWAWKIRWHPLLHTSLLVEASDSGALTSGHVPPGSQSDDEDRCFSREIPEMEVIRLIGLQFSRSIVSDCLPPHELQHTRPPCPSPIPRVRSDSHPSSQWCHPVISSSSSCPQSLPASESFPMSQLFAWGGQRTGVSALASFLPKKSQGWSPSK